MMTDWQMLDAIGSFGALVFSVVVSAASVTGWLLTRRELLRERKSRSRVDERAQASQVVAWVERRASTASGYPQASIVVSNASDLPVFNIDATVRWTLKGADIRSEDTFSFRLSVLGIATSASGLDRFARDILPPHSSQEWPLETRKLKGVADGSTAAVALTFEDVQQRRWRRDYGGGLQPELAKSVGGKGLGRGRGVLIGHETSDV